MKIRWDINTTESSPHCQPEITPPPNAKNAKSSLKTPMTMVIRRAIPRYTKCPLGLTLNLVGAAQPWISAISRVMRAYPKMSPRPSQILCRRIQLCPASRATCPPSITTPRRGTLPVGRRRSAVASGEHVATVAFGSGVIWPVDTSIRLSFIHFQFSWSSSGHSVRNFSPPSPALMLLMPLVVAWTPGAMLEWDPPPVEFHHRDRAANTRRSVSDALTLPVVISSLVINDSSPIRIVDTSHAGLKDLGWKSLMLRHSRVDGWNRPLGVCIRIAGGAKGYSGGKINVPQYCPFS